MQQLNEEQRRNLVVQYRVEHPEASKNDVAKYFHELGLASSTVYSILDRFAEGSSEIIKRKEGSGNFRKELKVDERGRARMAAEAQQGMSQREIARKHDVTQAFVSNNTAEPRPQCLQEGARSSCFGGAEAKAEAAH